MISAAVIALACCVAIAAAYEPSAATWSCTTKSTARIPDRASPIVWWQGTCVGKTPYGSVGPITVNTVTANMAYPGVVAKPAVAKTKIGLAPLSQIMRTAGVPSRPGRASDNMVAGINGGYFYRLDVKRFFDDVCIGKIAANAVRPVNTSQPIDGVGDGLCIRDGVVVSTNCGCLGYNRPSVLILNGTSTNIIVQHMHDRPPAGVFNAIAAGPNLVSVFPNGTTYVDIPADDQNLNRLGKSANTAVGFRRNDSSLILVTFDGTDSCGFFNQSCGINVFPMATFMKDYLGVTQAMGMDQGGSTTMVVKGKGKNGVVSCTSVPNCDGGERNIFNGLFVGLQW